MIAEKIKIALLYPCDPAAPMIGGVESFIRGMIKAAPEHIRYFVFGGTADAAKRPIGKWTECSLGGKAYHQFPLLRLPINQKRTTIPATLKHLFQAEVRLPDLNDFDIIESHRIEHILSARACHKPKNLFLHNTMDVVRNNASDIRWKFAPHVYFWLEKKVMGMVDSVFIVREEGVEIYREKYPEKKNAINFVSTPVDADLFRPLQAEMQAEHRARLRSELNFTDGDVLLAFVGRLDSSKDPELLLETFGIVLRSRPHVLLLVIGDGVLRDKLVDKAKSMGLFDRVRFLGFKTSVEVASLLQISDIFLLTSAYEGMPIALTEAMSCGLPAVTTDVGEVRRLIIPGVNGEVARTRSPEELADLVEKVCDNLQAYSGQPCWEAARPYTPDRVFQPVFIKYEELIEGKGSI